jgi:hypothetical protein
MDACAYPFGGTSAIPTREKLRSSNNLGKAVSITDHVLRPSLVSEARSFVP